MNLNNTPFSRLGSHLLDLLNALEGQEIPLIIVGGFGLSLRHQRIDETGIGTLLEPIPNVRTTEDIDAILKLTLIADEEKTLFLREALTRLGYLVVPTAQTYQFEKPETSTDNIQRVKIDFLARIPLPDQGDPELNVDKVLIRKNKKNNPLHARTTPEAIASEDTPLQVVIHGNLTSGESSQGTVNLPHPYALLLMKLFAFRDEHNDEKRREEKGDDPVFYARKHAGDVYTIIAMTSQEEYETLNNFKSKYQATEIGVEATRIVQEYFQDQTSMGVIRVRESHQDPPITLENLERFLEILKTTFL